MLPWHQAFSVCGTEQHRLLGKLVDCAATSGLVTGLAREKTLSSGAVLCLVCWAAAGGWASTMQHPGHWP